MSRAGRIEDNLSRFSAYFAILTATSAATMVGIQAKRLDQPYSVTSNADQQKSFDVTDGDAAINDGASLQEHVSVLVYVEQIQGELETVVMILKSIPSICQ